MHLKMLCSIDAFVDTIAFAEKRRLADDKNLISIVMCVDF